VEGVAAGSYTLQIHLTEPRGDGMGMGAPIASLSTDVVMPDIPGGASDHPLDLGDIKLNVRVELAVGAAAPSVEAKTLDNEPLTLDEFRGKVVALYFWASGAEAFEAELEPLKRLHQAHAKEGRVAIVGLRLDQDADAARAFVRKHELPWHNGCLGDLTRNQSAQNYIMRGFPSFFVIGSDGKLLAKDLDSASLAEAVGKALK
jgi:peroxiredoxin